MLRGDFEYFVRVLLWVGVGSGLGWLLSICIIGPVEVEVHRQEESMPKASPGYRGMQIVEEPMCLSVIVV